MIARFAAAALLAVLVSQVQAASIKWTGYASNNQWTSNTNWYPDNVPGPNDDVTIDSGYVIITTPVTVNSIGMGNEFSHMANLSVLSSLTVISTLTVDGNGNLELTSGATTVTGTVNIAGTLLFTAGSISGQWTVSSRGSANLGGGGEKVFSGCGFNSSGPVSATGLLVLNQSSVIGITSTLTASGNFLVQAQDNTAVILDTSAGTLTYTGGGTFSVQAPISFGTFNFQGGNLTLFDSVNFIDSFALPSGSVLRTLGTAVVMIPAGITGSGEVHAEGTSLLLGNANFSGSLIATAGTVAISSASSVSTLTINGASVSSTGSLMVGTLNIQDGAIQYGDGTITASTASILTAGFTLNGSVVISGSASCIGSVLAFAQHGQVTITSGATFTTTSSVIFTGPPGTGGVINHGTLNVQGALQFQNIDLSGSGVSTVSDSLSLNTITVSQSTVTLTGNGVFKGATTEITGIGAVMGSPNVAATIGSYSFECKSECLNIRTVGIPTSNFHFKIKNGSCMVMVPSVTERSSKV